MESNADHNTDALFSCTLIVQSPVSTALYLCTSGGLLLGFFEDWKAAQLHRFSKILNDNICKWQKILNLLLDFKVPVFI